MQLIWSHATFRKSPSKYGHFDPTEEEDLVSRAKTRLKYHLIAPEGGLGRRGHKTPSVGPPRSCEPKQRNAEAAARRRRLGRTSTTKSRSKAPMTARHRGYETLGKAMLEWRYPHATFDLETEAQATLNSANT
ncbi:Auxin-responsive protein [Psidium guajava]|nr:Auxin-responsive protein [Psidium guajava]